ncbi:hypothetical protein [Oxalicibacterium faecigallinarum]|uniref:Uncharacterized protein n=1 Tax=Oxalicibacterium faecigallinarum TaxID=573741 RepID=A0A8J3F0K3_9BURK|nr:hypothetical protein [Oxalicibacterium faecigallinarum]GGI16402.1 hypothetical protein GCM10008066_03780 [Oxalicibacterium faecigallinarum]
MFAFTVTVLTTQGTYHYDAIAPTSFDAWGNAFDVHEQVQGIRVTTRGAA